MAGDWIKVEHVTPDKPEIYVMASELGVSPEDVFGRCVRIWIWADQQSRDGHAITVTNVTLDAVSRRDGFASALTKCGWLIDNQNGTVSFPNFDRHNGDTAKTRAQSNKRQKGRREREKDNNANVTQNITQTSRSDRDISVTREENRREEVNITSTNVDKDKQVCPPCPIEEIISIYHETLPTSPQVRVRTLARDKQIKARWKQFYQEGDFKDSEGGVACFRWFFDQVRQSRFLTGQTDKPFFADLEWLTKASNFAKVVEGKYGNR